MKKLVIFWYLIFCFISLSAEEIDEKHKISFLNIYDFQLIKINNTNEFEIGNDIFRSGFLGIPKDFKDILSIYPDSKRSINSYSKLNIAGNVIYWSSTVTWLGLIVATGVTEDYAKLSRNYNIGAAIFIGGVLIYSVLISSAREKLYESINIYNRNRISKYE
jgi:hypothetical protein